MANNSTAFQEQDFSKGINESVPENAIPEGYLETAQNVLVGATIEKRKGYRLHGGALPIRVASVQAVAPDSLYLSFPVDVNLAALKDQPIIIYGRLSKQLTNNVFSVSEDRGKYLLAPSIDARRIIGSGEVSTVLYAEETLLETDDIIAGAAESLSQTDTSNSLCEIDEISIDATTKNITFTTNSTESPRGFYLYYIDPTDGSYSYHAEDFSSSSTWTVNPTLPSTNYIIRCYNTSGQVIYPASVVFDSGTGQITIQFADELGPVNVEGRVVILCAEPENFVQGDQIAPATGEGATTSTVTLPAGSIELNYGFVESYIYTGSTFELVKPESVVVGADGSVVVTYLNAKIEGHDLRIVWASTNVIAKVGITLNTGDVTSSDTDFNPQLCVYGISQEGVFTGPQASDRTGWVTGVDYYRTETYENLVASSGLNTYVLKNAADTNTSLTLMPTHMVNLRCRTAALGTEPIIGPAFLKTVVAPARSRGYLHSATGVSTAGEVVGDSLTWVSGTTLRITIPLADLAVSGTPIEAGRDFVTISQAPYSWLVGTHRITAYTATASTSVTLDISIDRATSARFDIASGANIKLGIFSDKLEFAAPCPFIPDDVLQSSLFPAGGLEVNYVAETDGTSTPVYVTGVSSRIVLTQGFQIICSRPECDVFGMRLNSNASVDEANLNIVVGDCVRLAGSDAADVAEVVEVWPRNTFIAKVTGAIVDITGAPFDTSELEEGQEFLVIQSGEYTGVQTIKSIDSGTQFTIEYVGTGSNLDFYMQGPTVSIDTPCEFTDSLNDESTVAVEARWLAIEPPKGTDGSLVNEPRKSQFSGNSGDQPLVRSTMVKDTMYFTNGIDPVWKYDGINYMRAGLPRWQPIFFSSAWINTNFIPASLSSGSKTFKAGIVDSTYKWPQYDSNSFFIAGDASADFKAGEYLRYEGGVTSTSLTAGEEYLIKEVIVAKVSSDPSVSTTTEKTMTQIRLYETVSLLGASYATSQTSDCVTVGCLRSRHYFRLQYIDSNNNIVSSAVVQSNDFYHTLFSDSTIVFKALGLPKYDLYDYSRFEIEIYRSPREQLAGPFRRVVNVSIPATAITTAGVHDNQYPLYIADSIAEASLQLSTSDLDPVATAIGGSELPTNVYPPPIGKYITSIDGRLALAAVFSSPKISLRLLNGDYREATYDDFIGANPYEGLIVTLRKDNADTATATNFTDRVSIRFVSTPIETVKAADVIPVSDKAYNAEIHIPVADRTKYASGSYIYIEQKGTTASTYRKVSDRFAGWHKIQSITTTSGSTGILVLYSNIASRTSTGTAERNQLYAYTGGLSCSSPGSVDTGTEEFTVTSAPETGTPFVVSGFIPTPLVADTKYYAIKTSSTKFKLATTMANALAGTAINLTATGGSGLISFSNADAYDGDLRIYGGGVSGLTSSTSYIPVNIYTDYNYGVYSGAFNQQLIIDTAARRMRDAFNWIAATEPSAAWYLAEAGGDFPTGTLNILFPVPLETTPEIELPSTFDSKRIKIFGNGIYRPLGGSVGATQRYRGSRVCVSYRNYPEMFENPDIEDSSTSTNVYDINPADGQDITAIMPLLSSSVSQASQLEGILLVWKTNSIYAVNVNLGTIQKIDTNGVGCGAPYSTAYIYGGLAFATDAGIFFIDRSLKIRNLGEACERTWNTLLSSASIAELQGHHHPATSTFKLSAPNGTSIVANYDIMQEGGIPAFTTFTNTFVTGGWCNYENQEVYASRYNRVCISRDTGTEQDYRDDAGAQIPMIVDFRMTNFGDSTIRKQVRNLGITFRNYVISHSGIGAYMAVNGQKTWTALDSAKLEADSNRKIQNLKFSLPNTKFNHLQIRVTDSELDRPLEISGIHYRVVGLTPFGIKTAKESTES